METVEVRGVEGVNMGELQNTLATQATRCRSIFLRPFCMIWRSSLFVERHNLELAELPRDELRIRVYLWRRGWRYSTVQTEVVPEGGSVAVVFNVNQGPETLFSSVELEQTEPVLSDKQVRAARLPGTGDRVNVVDIDSARVRLLTAYGERGYADAQVRDTIILLDETSAVGRFVLEPGKRATIGDIRIAGNEEVSEGTIREALAIREGRIFRAGEVAEAQRALFLTGMFTEALVQVPPQQDSAKTLLVTVDEAPFRMVRTGVGFNTADFVQLQTQYTHFNWLGNGRRLDVTGTVGRLFAGTLDGVFPFDQVRRAPVPGAGEDAFSRPTWQASVQILQPAFPASANSFGLGLFSHRRIEPGVVVDRGFGGTATLTRSFGRRAPLSLLYRYELNRVFANDVYFCVSYGVCDQPTIASLQGERSLSPVGLSGFVDQVDDALIRRDGYTVRLGLEHASAATLSDFHYNRADAEITWDFEIAGGTLATRLHAGWVNPLGSAEGDDPLLGGTQLHPTKRFYAGGARSVRGYGENQLGPRILTIGREALLGTGGDGGSDVCTPEEINTGACDPNPVESSRFTPRPVGGTRLVEAGVEYRRPLFGPFVGAIFVDGARVSDPTLDEMVQGRSAITPGFGVRYSSPIGPVRIDLGIRSAADEELTVITELDEGVEQRLIRLDVPKRFDPAEGSGGFLSSVTNRLTLHLSIGESF